MTEIKFFFNIDDKLGFACKWVRKAYDDGRKLVVYTSGGRMADEFDRRLWEFSQLSFVPHVKANHPLAAETPIIIAGDDANLPHHEVLLNLADEPPPFFSRFDVLRELVSHDDEDRARARDRTKFYKSRGFDVTHQDMKANG